MNYNEAVEFIHSAPKFARVLGNDMLGRLLGYMSNPQNNLKFIHIAGTNGKGSAARMLSEIFTQAGYKTGMFISPYIVRFNERIQINNRQIPDSDLAEAVTYVKDIMEKYDAQVSEFALDTAVAFKYFSDNQVDIAILETGMGGRLDATNVIEQNELELLMHISLDHTQYLGDTIEEIAAEKCGIIKPESDVAVYPDQEEGVWSVIERVCREKGARLHKAMMPKATDTGFIYGGTEYKLSLKGAYQPYNAAAVLEAVRVLRGRGWELSEQSVRDAFLNVEWQARFEFIADDIVIDGGHNPDGIRALGESLRRIGKPVVLVTAMMADKLVDECAAEMAAITDKIITTELPMPRCIDARELAKRFPDAYVCPSISDAVKKAREINTGLICICGSLYLCGEIKRMRQDGRI